MAAAALVLAAAATMGVGVAGASAAQTPPASSRRPPMGWRSWNLFELKVSQPLLEGQIDGLARRRHSVNGTPTSLLDLGYSSIGLDDGWQNCGGGVNKTYHAADGTPLVNLTLFPDMHAMVAKGHAAGVQMGWYANNCWCNENTHPFALPYYEGNAKALVGYGFDAIKVDSCGPATNITSWREALDAASAAAGRPRVQLENCRNFKYTANLTSTAECAADLFRSTEDNAPDFLSIMANSVMNDLPPGSNGNGWGGLPVSHPECWSYPDMLETIGSGQCRTDLANGTCGYASPERRSGGLSLNESKAHFSAWCVVSSPLVLGHDLADNETYDAAWPVISNPEAIRVDQMYDGDAGRLIASATEKMTGLTLYHGAGCECVWPGQVLPRWTVWAKRLSSGEAAALAINLSDETLPAGTISIDAAKIFGQGDTDAGSVAFTRERDLWERRDAPWSGADVRAEWAVPELAPRSSYFTTLHK